jgi:hypothetical protein
MPDGTTAFPDFVAISAVTARGAIFPVAIQQPTGGSPNHDRITAASGDCRPGEILPPDAESAAPVGLPALTPAGQAALAAAQALAKKAAAAALLHGSTNGRTAPDPAARPCASTARRQSPACNARWRLRPAARVVA